MLLLLLLASLFCVATNQIATTHVQQDQLCKKTGLSNTARKARKLQSKLLH